MKRRVIRGGSYHTMLRYLRTTYRVWDGPEYRDRYVGSRIVVVRRKKP